MHPWQNVSQGLGLEAGVARQSSSKSFFEQMRMNCSAQNAVCDSVRDSLLTSYAPIQLHSSWCGHEKSHHLMILAMVLIEFRCLSGPWAQRLGFNQPTSLVMSGLTGAVFWKCKVKVTACFQCWRSLLINPSKVNVSCSLTLLAVLHSRSDVFSSSCAQLSQPLVLFCIQRFSQSFKAGRWHWSCQACRTCIRFKLLF
jgi:hypothetical protein